MLNHFSLCSKCLLHSLLLLLLSFLDLLNYSYIHLYLLLHCLMLLLLRMFCFLLLLLHVVLYLCLFLSNLLYNLNHFSLCSRCLLCLFHFLLLNFLDLLSRSYIHLYLLLHRLMLLLLRMFCFLLTLLHVIL